MRRIGIFLVLLATTVGACASGSSSSAAKPSASSTTSGPLTETQRVVGAGMVVAADVPGAVMRPRTPSGLSDREAQKVASCRSFLDRKRDGFLERRSHPFTRNGVTVRSATSAHSTSGEVATQLDLARDPATFTCVGDLLRKLVTARLPATTTLDHLSVSPIAVNEVGDDVSALRVTTALTAGTQQTTELTDIIDVQVGRYRLRLDVDARTTAELAEVETTLLPKLVDRMKRAGA
ncbi:MAG: hypothetical protein ABJC79_07480 [Acidimicrobiia bacterium]